MGEGKSLNLVISVGSVEKRTFKNQNICIDGWGTHTSKQVHLCYMSIFNLFLCYRLIWIGIDNQTKCYLYLPWLEKPRLKVVPDEHLGYSSSWLRIIWSGNVLVKKEIIESR